jgi:hypothetical protein
LKVEIYDEAFTRIYVHRSRPFPVKKGHKIAVRVINQFGEETTKVLEVNKVCLKDVILVPASLEGYPPIRVEKQIPPPII